MRYIDLTHKFTAQMPVFIGDTPAKLFETETVEKHDFGHFRIETGMHVGTHIDAPLHFIAGGKKLSDFGPEKFIGRGVLIDARGKMEIGANLLRNVDWASCTHVLVHTGMSQKYREADYFENYPVLTEEFAKEIVRRSAKGGQGRVEMVGLDFCSPDRSPYEIHKILLGAEVLIIENLTNADQLVGVKEFEVIALPPFFEAEAAPGRVVARV